MTSDRSWEWASDPIRAVGGRNRYNALRRERARIRRDRILLIMNRSGMSFVTRGVQRMLAQRLGVSEATISRDLVGILAPRREKADPCPFCGAKPLTEAAALAIRTGRLPWQL